MMTMTDGRDSKICGRSQDSAVLRKSDSGADSGVTLHKLSEQFDDPESILWLWKPV